MTDLGEPTIQTPPPRTLFEVGYEYMVDSMRRDTTDTPADRFAMAQTAALHFAAGQNAALLAIADHLAALAEQQHAANFIAGVGALYQLELDEAYGVDARIRELIGLPPYQAPNPAPAESTTGTEAS